jgi:hypothetical protein
VFFFHPFKMSTIDKQVMPPKECDPHTYQYLKNLSTTSAGLNKWNDVWANLDAIPDLLLFSTIHKQAMPQL